jgi:hypothetical protein
VEAKRQSASRREGTAADGEYLRSDMRQLDEVLFHETDHKRFKEPWGRRKQKAATR